MEKQALGTQRQVVTKVLSYLNAMRIKDASSFDAFFNAKRPFLDILPGGKRVDGPELLIRHAAFFSNPMTNFSPLNPDTLEVEKTEFTERHMIEINESPSHFHCFVGADVMKTKVLGEGSELVNDKMYLGLLWVLEGDEWYLRKIQNTVINQ